MLSSDDQSQSSEQVHTTFPFNSDREKESNKCENVLDSEAGPSEAKPQVFHKIIEGTNRNEIWKYEQKILTGSGGVKIHDDMMVEEEPEIIIHYVCYEPICQDPSSFPLVLIHGYGLGLACFYKNFSSLCEKRRVYAIDLPGFALSSRVDLGNLDSQKCRDRIVELIEKWRSKMSIRDSGLEKFIILGHSFGGYLAASYAIKHKEQVKHLIMADPWGILSKEEDKIERGALKVGFKSAAMTTLAIFGLNPNRIVRKAGCFGKDLKRFLSPGIERTYGILFIQYVFHACIEIPPTGEEGFAKISDNYMWPQYSLKDSLMELHVSVPITFLYSKNTRYKYGVEIFKRDSRKNITVKDAFDAGHHIHADCPKEFNCEVNTVCEEVDKNSIDI